MSGEIFVCADDVVVVGEDSVNEVAAAAQLAAALGGPLLHPHPQLAAELGRLKPTRIHLVGDLDVVTPPMPRSYSTASAAQSTRPNSPSGSPTSSGFPPLPTPRPSSRPLGPSTPRIGWCSLRPPRHPPRFPPRAPSNRLRSSRAWPGPPMPRRSGSWMRPTLSPCSRPQAPAEPSEPVWSPTTRLTSWATPRWAPPSPAGRQRRSATWAPHLRPTPGSSPFS